MTHSRHRRATLLRPAVLLAALIPLHLVGQRLLLGRFEPALLVLPLLAVAAFELADRAAERRRQSVRAARDGIRRIGSE